MSRTHPFAVVFRLLASLINLFRFHNLVKVARQSLAVGLIVMLVTNHTLAASGIAGAVVEFGQELRLRWYAKGWANTFSFSLFGQGGGAPRGWDGKGAPPRPRPGPQPREKKGDRERKLDCRLDLWLRKDRHGRHDLRDD